MGRLHQAETRTIRAREIRLLSAQIRTGGGADDGTGGRGDVLMMEVFAGIAGLLFAACVVYAFYEVVECIKHERDTDD